MASHGVALQSIHWAQLKDNWDSRLFAGFNENNEIVCAAMVLIKRLPLGYSMYYIPRGPIAENLEDMAELLNYIKKESKKDHCVFIKFDPYILDHAWMPDEERPAGHNDEAVRFLSEKTGAIHKGYTMTIEETVQPRTNMGVNLVDDFDKKYSRSIRRKLKSAAKAGARPEMYTAADLREHPKALDEFCRLMHCTEERKDISLRDREYFERMMNDFDGARLWLCNTDEHGYVCGMMGIGYHDKMELLYMGNDLNLANRTGAASVLYDTAYHYAKDHGMNYADMSGVDGHLNDGLFDHKRLYGADIREYIGEFDIPVMPLVYRAVLPLYNRRKGIS